LRWLRANGKGPIVAGGESAGAHLAALALLELRAAGELDGIAAANLAYGVYDVSMTPSARLWGDERVVVNTADLAFYAAQYAPRELHREPGVSPLYADLRGLPPALFSCGTGDPLLDDTLFMAARWQAAGNAAELALYERAPHEFLNLREPVAAAAVARARMAAFVRAALRGPPPAPAPPAS
jgi:acetyl esterase/lipase